MVYFTLPSDSSVDYFPDNTVARFRVKLPQEYEFDGEYECGLVQLQYPSTWATLSDADTLRIKAAVVSREDGKWRHRSAVNTLKPGRYRDVEMLLYAINRRLSTLELEGPCNFHMDAVTRRVELTYQGPLDIRIRLHDVVREMLGFDTTSKWLSAGARSVRPVDLRRGFHNIYVYTDLIQATHVTGHTLQPLLRSIPAQGEDGDMVLVQPTHIQYFPLRSKRVRTVEVFLATDMGEPVPFTSGKSQITVHIRRTRPMDI